MRDSCTLHLESFQGPVACGYCPDEARGDVVALELKCLICVEFARAGRLLEYFVDGGFKLRVEALEEIFKEKCKQLTCSAISMLGGRVHKGTKIRTALVVYCPHSPDRQLVSHPPLPSALSVSWYPQRWLWV